ncbi:MAG TPA: hypothetical protein VLL03_01315 [Burkholderiales bacterium]|nr:hypothetical protein [Burkholderiales bacterium]
MLSIATVAPLFSLRWLFGCLIREFVLELRKEPNYSNLVISFRARRN